MKAVQLHRDGHGTSAGCGACWVTRIAVCHRQSLTWWSGLQMAKVTSVFAEPPTSMDPILFTLDELLESKGLRQLLTPDEFEWVVEVLGPRFTGVAQEMLAEVTTTRMDLEHSVELWMEGVETAWRRSTCTLSLTDVLRRSMDIDGHDLGPVWNEFKRRCDYTASVRGQSTVVMRSMEKAIVDFVAQSAAVVLGGQA